MAISSRATTSTVTCQQLVKRRKLSSKMVVRTKLPLIGAFRLSSPLRDVKLIFLRCNTKTHSMSTTACLCGRFEDLNLPRHSSRHLTCHSKGPSKHRQFLTIRHRSVTHLLRLQVSVLHLRTTNSSTLCSSQALRRRQKSQPLHATNHLRRTTSTIEA